MSIPIPLAVRLSTSRGDRHVTRDVHDLTFGWSDPGGFTSCRVSLDRPLTLQPDEVAYYGQMTVYDARNGSVVWDGRLEDPGRSAGSNGQIWDLAGVGGQAHTLDRTVALIYQDQPLNGLERVDNFTPGGDASVGTDPGDAAGLRTSLVLKFPQGLALQVGARVVMRYNAIQRSGQKIARLDHKWDAGRTDTNFQVQMVTRTDGSLGSGENPRSDNFNTAGGGSSPKVIVTDFPSASGRNTVEWRINYSGASAGTASGDNYWASVYDLVVQATRYTQSGTEQLTAAPYTANYVLASDIVADLLGRLLNQFDGTGATISTTSYQIDQLAYPDGVTPSKVLADLLALEPGFTWRAWERNSSGNYRFEWTPVPSSVRYEADVRGNYDSQGSANGLYNRVLVRWTDPNGHVHTTERTATVPALDAAGLIRQGSIDLGTEVGSLAAAQQAGDAWLADRQYPPNAGQLKIYSPVLDLQTGRMVMPWEIRPGLIRVRGILPRPDALNATARDGVTVFRIVASEYRASDAAATLELDSYAPSTARLLADARRATIRR